MARRLAARPGAEPRCRTSCEDASTWSAARNRGSTPTYDRVEAAAGIALYAGLAAVPVRAGEARPRCPWAAAGPGRTSPSNTSAAGVEGAGGPGGHGRASGPGSGAGGWRQGQGGPRDRPLRAFRLACGDLAGGPPPTGTHSGRAPQSITTERPEHQRRHKQHNNRHHTNAPRHTKNRHPDRMSACGGARGIRTPDLLIANETRYQLRHSPKDSNSLAPWRSATQADHDHVRDTTDRKKRSDSPVYATPLPNTTPRRYRTLRNAHEAR